MKNSIFLTGMLLPCWFTIHAQSEPLKITISNEQGRFMPVDAQHFFSDCRSNPRSPFPNIPVENPGVPMPVIITAIPYDGFDDSNLENEFEMTFEKNSYRYCANYSHQQRKINTYDSNEVIFLVPRISRFNADEYQFRVLLNGKIILKSWQDITEFNDNRFATNYYDGGMAILGAYKTTWNNYLQIELKQKTTDTLLSTAIVYWHQVKPVLLNIYTAAEICEFLDRLKKPGQYADAIDFSNKYKANQLSELDPATGLPKKLAFAATTSNLIFYLQGNIYQKESLEYKLIKDGKIYNNWKANTFDDSFIWLKDLEPGRYKLEMRFRAQRQNITTTLFAIQSAYIENFLQQFLLLLIIVITFGIFFYLWKLYCSAKVASIKKPVFNFANTTGFSLNTHFILTALSSIQRLITTGKLSAANFYLGEFGQFLRAPLTQKDKESSSIDQQLAILENFIRLEQLRFHFQYILSIETSLDKNIDLPSQLVHSLVSHTITERMSLKRNNGLLQVLLSRIDTDLVVTVVDNGQIFMDPGASRSTTITALRERIRFLNSNYVGRMIMLSFRKEKDGLNVAELKFSNWL